MENGKQSAFTGIVNEAYQHGLTKREYFAGLAMQGILSDGGIVNSKSHIAEQAVNLANELLKQLEL
jgi:hypothetical protein